MGSFISIDESMPRRVKNVKIDGEAINPEEVYTLSGSFYMLTTEC